MLSKRVESALNEQVKLEADSSNFYLAMASWAENQGYAGVAEFLYAHSDEERFHMLKLVKFINERDGVAVIPALEQPKISFTHIREAFDSLYEHEVVVTKSIGDLVGICLEERDFNTHNFLQWYVTEQLEEEALAKSIIDKIKLMGNEPGIWYHFDRDVVSMRASSAAQPAQGA